MKHIYDTQELNINGERVPGVYASELHRFLHVKEEFATWLPDAVSHFDKDIDYWPLPNGDCYLSADILLDIGMRAATRPGATIRRRLLHAEQTVAAMQELYGRPRLRLVKPGGQ